MKNRSAPGTSAYNTRIFNGSFRSTPNFLRAAVDLTRAGAIFDAWDLLTNHMDQRLGKDYFERFPDTWEEQIDRYGMGIRAIHVTSGNFRLNAKGHFIDLQGQIFNGRIGGSDFYWEYWVQ